VETGGKNTTALQSPARKIFPLCAPSDGGFDRDAFGVADLDIRVHDDANHGFVLAETSPR